MLRVWDEKKAKLTLTLFWYFVWPQKQCLDGPLLDSFIILRDPRKRKGENISLDQRRKKGKSDRKRPKRQLLVATALDWSLCLGRSGRCPGQQLPAFTTKFPPDFTSSPHFGSNFDSKHGDRDSISDTLYIGWWELSRVNALHTYKYPKILDLCEDLSMVYWWPITSMRIWWPTQWFPSFICHLYKSNRYKRNTE